MNHDETDFFSAHVPLIHTLLGGLPATGFHFGHKIQKSSWWSSFRSGMLLHLATHVFSQTDKWSIFLQKKSRPDNEVRQLSLVGLTITGRNMVLYLIIQKSYQFVIQPSK